MELKWSVVLATVHSLMGELKPNPTLGSNQKAQPLHLLLSDRRGHKVNAIGLSPVLMHVDFQCGLLPCHVDSMSCAVKPHALTL